MFSEFCDQVQNRLVFPAISSIFICLIYYTGGWFNRLIFVGFFLFFLLKESKALLYISLFCSFTILFFCWLKETEPIEIDHKNVTERVMVFPDTVKLNGDWVTFVGRTINKQKIHLSYLAKSEKERNSFLALRSEAVEIVVSGDYQAPQQQRNKYTFDQINYDKVHRIKGRFQISQFKETLKKNTWKNFFSRKRGKWMTFIQKNFPSKTSIYMNALLFGHKASQFIQSEKIYRESGLLHLFSLSGMHLQTYLGGIYYLFRRGGWTLAGSFIPLCFITLSYLLLAGGTISVMRAGLLFLLKLTLKLFQ
ncbi:MAG: ComEC family DNA internalization-related competence protein [Enterococcus lacertideformus]|uniref:ComEC family DNA internalization-related competence protein n=1 Tax=Enterococcus lacertideformus TaxID=2771493 RepID=A0A931AUE6_9ENTE|nr:ComEC family DNA internalization-related competence protein [Enterococcus lacertideformus]